MGSMMSIGEFAGSVGLSVSAVRFYADRGLLMPAHIEAASGYRFYAAEQLSVGRLICDLRRIEMPLAQVEKALTASSDERRALIDDHLARLGEELIRARAVAASIGNGDTHEGSREVLGARMSKVRTPDLLAAVAQVLPFAAVDAEMPDLMSVLIECRDGSIRLVATDRHRLAVRDIVLVESGIEFVAPIASATLRRWHARIEAPEMVALGVDDGHLVVQGDGVDLRARSLPTVFPDYENIVASFDSHTSVLVDRQLILEALDSFDDASAVELIVESADEVLLRHAASTRPIPATVSGPGVQVALDPIYASECLRNAIGGDVVIEIEGPLHPVLFRSAGDGTYTTMLMPIQLS